MYSLLTRFRYSFLYHYDMGRTVKILCTIFSIVGVCLTLVEGFSWIFDNTEYPAILKTFIKEKIVYCVLIIIFISTILNRRKIKIQKEFIGTNLSIIVEFCDIFKQIGATVINVMDTFDTTVANKLVNPQTIYGQFILKYYPTDIQLLDNELFRVLSSIGVSPIQNDPNLKGKKERFAIGTTCPITTHNKHFYLTALTFMTETGNVRIEPAYIYDFLSCLWSAIPTHGVYNETINIPVIATGINRLPAKYTHQIILNEIIKSFFVCSKQGTFCKTLKICLHIKDFKYYEFDDIKVLFDYIDKNQNL